MTQRRYNEAEVREILERAIDSRDHALPPGEQGMTLAEIKSIGSEVGIDGASLERAARSLEVSQPRSKGILGSRMQEFVHRDGDPGLVRCPEDDLRALCRP